MELQELRYLLALADELNFTRAAARCRYLSVPDLPPVTFGVAHLRPAGPAAAAFARIAGAVAQWSEP